MFNFVALAICFLFLRAVWSFQLPAVSDDHSRPILKLTQNYDKLTRDQPAVAVARN